MRAGILCCPSSGSASDSGITFLNPKSVLFPMAFQIPMFKQDEPREEEQKQGMRSDNFKDFMADPATKDLVKEWSSKEGFTRRGVVEMLNMAYRLNESDKRAREKAKAVLSMLKGKDGFRGALASLKLIPEGFFKALKG